MTPEERQLIAGLFDRMRGYNLPQKDGEAEALINESVRAIADAPYMLVQSVLVQEHALQEADKRIEALEEQVRTLQAEGRQPASSGGFLGGLFGGGRDEQPRAGGSVPQIGARATPSAYGNGGTWTPGGPQAPLGAQRGAQPGGGGFLQTAMATAAGVAGGMLVAGAIGSLLGSNSANAATPDAAGAGSTGEGAGANNDAAASPPPPTEEEQPVHDTADDGDGGWFGGDTDMGDFDI